jgi:hypothetical protein
MIFAPIGLFVSAVFAGAAFYVTLSEQPARLRLDDRSLLAEWKPSYARGTTMQAPLALIGAILGGASFIAEHSLLAGIAGLLMLANLPWTLLVIMPVNRRIKHTAPENAGPASRTLILKWGELHAVRTAFGLGAAALFCATIVH